MIQPPARQAAENPDRKNFKIDFQFAHSPRRTGARYLCFAPTSDGKFARYRGSIPAFFACIYLHWLSDEEVRCHALYA